jgi:hypothetical protein
LKSHGGSEASVSRRVSHLPCCERFKIKGLCKWPDVYSRRRHIAQDLFLRVVVEGEPFLKVSGLVVSPSRSRIYASRQLCLQGDCTLHKTFV